MKLGFKKNHMLSRDLEDYLTDHDYVLKLKFCIAGAFIDRYNIS